MIRDTIDAIALLAILAALIYGGPLIQAVFLRP